MGHRRPENPAHLVRGRQAQRSRQLPRPPSEKPDARQDRHHLAGRAGRGRAGRSPTRNCTKKSANSPTSLKSQGVKKGDRVAIYLPMIPEAADRDARPAPASAPSTPSFSAASAPTRSRTASTIRPANCSITANVSLRAGKTHSAQSHRRRGAANNTPSIENVDRRQTQRRTRAAMKAGRDVWYHDVMAQSHRRIARRKR